MFHVFFKDCFLQSIVRTWLGGLGASTTACHARDARCAESPRVWGTRWKMGFDHDWIKNEASNGQACETGLHIVTDILWSCMRIG